MIGFITGRVDHIGTNFCLVDTQGVGYRIFLNTGGSVPDSRWTEK